MKARSTLGFFRAAIAGSLAVHLIIAAVLHSHAVQAAPEQPPGHLRYLVMKLPKPTPTPPAVKPHVQKPQRQNNPARRPDVQLIRTHNINAGQHNVVVVASALPGTPGPYVDPTASTGGDSGTPVPAAPTPTPKPACSAPDVAARAIDTVAPQAPPDSQGQQAQTKVRVDLDASGSVTGASVYATSGDQLLDMAAVRAAKASRYAPEERNCKNIPGSYLFTVDFQE